MDSKTLASEIEQTITSAFSAWSREVVTNKDGSVTLPPELLPRFFKAQANNLAATYADRLLSDSAWSEESPRGAMAKAVQMFAIVAEVQSIDSADDLEATLGLREMLCETLLLIAKQGRGDFGSLLLVVSENIGHVDSLIESYNQKEKVLS